MHNSFKIFKPDNKTFLLNLNNILLILLLLFGFLNILDIEYISKIAEKGILLIFFIGFIVLFANIFRKKPLIGKLEGTITFNSDTLLINDRIIALNDFKRIVLRTHDYEGLSSIYGRPSLFPVISNGTNNLLDLELKNGEKIKTFFKIEYESQTEELIPFVISLIKYNLISTEKGIEILQLQSDYMIEKFIDELNEKELG